LWNSPKVRGMNVLSSAFIPVSANKNVVRGTLCVLLFSSIAGAAALLAEPGAARQDSLQEAIVALANEVLAIRELHGPFHIDWRNDSSLSTAQSAALQSEFSARLATVRGLVSDDAGAPPLRVTLRETATQLVAVARVSTPEGEQVRLVQATRDALAPQDSPQTTPSLQKELLWRQREPILDATERPAGASSALLVLGRETLSVYARAQDQFELQGVAHIPGTVHPSRALAGRLRFPNDDSHFTLELPGKTCAGTLAEKMTLECVTSELRAPGNGKEGDAAAPGDSPKPVALCDNSAWILSSGDADWSKSDRLSLHDSRSAAFRGATVLETPGPVLSLTSGRDAASSIGVVLNLATGEYEVYRFALACHN
jgi:hypothetical protein